MNNDDEFVYANAKIRNEEKLLLVQKYHLKHENNAWYSERENSHKHLIFRDDFFERADLIGLLFRINKLCIAKVKYFRQNIGKYEPLKYDYKRGFISVPLWDAEFLKHRDSGLILDFRYLQTMDALKREFLEETGIVVEPGKIIAVRFNSHDWYVAFSADYVSGEAVSDHDENDEVLWMETEEALLRDDVPNLTKELIRCALSGAKGLVPIPYQGNPKNGKGYLYGVD